jgi:hypothetical protein
MAIRVDDVVFAVDDGVTCEDVWAVIVDLPRYPEWSEFMVGVEVTPSSSSSNRQGDDGQVQPGDRLTLTVMLNGHRTVAEERITHVEEVSGICWAYNGLTPSFLLRSERWLRVMKREGSGEVVVSSHITFHGPLSGVVLRMEGANIESGFRSLQTDLKKRVLSLRQSKA